MPSLFPQMSTGSVTQFPILSSERFLTRVTDVPDYGETVYAEWEVPYGAWTLQLKSTSDADAAVLKSFFDSQYGMYGRFIFLDPIRNLLSWSEDYTQSIWTKAHISFITPGFADPLGGMGASTLVTGASGTPSVGQVLPFGPGSQSLSPFPNLWLTASIWLKGTLYTSATLQISDGGSQVGQVSIALTPTWTRYSVSFNFSASAPQTMLYNLVLQNLETVYVFGPSLMYLPSAGDYGKTGVQTGVHPICRFDQDTWPWVHTGPGVSSVADITVTEIAG